MLFYDIPPYIFHYLTQFLKFEINQLSATCKRFQKLTKNRFHKYISCEKVCSFEESLKNDHFGCLIKYPQCVNNKEFYDKIFETGNLSFYKWFNQKIKLQFSCFSTLADFTVFALKIFAKNGNLECFRYAIGNHAYCRRKVFDFRTYVVGAYYARQFHIIEYIVYYHLHYLEEFLIWVCFKKDDVKFLDFVYKNNFYDIIANKHEIPKKNIKCIQYLIDRGCDKKSIEELII